MYVTMYVSHIYNIISCFHHPQSEREAQVVPKWCPIVYRFQWPKHKRRFTKVSKD